MDKIRLILEEIDGKVVSIDEAFLIMENIYDLYTGKISEEQIEMDLVFS